MFMYTVYPTYNIRVQSAVVDALCDFNDPRIRPVLTDVNLLRKSTPDAIDNALYYTVPGSEASGQW